MELTSESLERWRAAIRDDINERYLLSMAIAIQFQDGAAAALPWLEKARQSAVAHKDAATCALLQALDELEENERAACIRKEAAAQNAVYELVGLRDLGAFYIDTPVVPQAACADILTRAANLARECGDPASIGETSARLAVHCARLGQFAKASAALDGRTFSAAPETIALLRELEIAAAPQETALWAAAAQALIAAINPDVEDGERILNQVADRAAGLEQRVIMVDALRRALVIDPHAAAARLRLALHHIREGEEAAAIQLLNEAPDSGLTDANLTATLSNLLFLTGRGEEADRRSAQNLANHPDHVGATQQRTLLLIASGRSQEAITIIEPFANEQPSNPSFASSLALGLHHLGRSGEALARLQAPLAAVSSAGGAPQPWLPWYACIRGVIQEASGLSDDAARSFAEAARLAKPRELAYHLRIRPTIAAAAVRGLRNAGMEISLPPPQTS